MTRQEVYSLALSELPHCKCLILQLATGFGKSKLAIDLTNHLLGGSAHTMKILLLVAKTVHKQNWQDEIQKWGGFTGNSDITVECYNSLPKHSGETFDVIIADEAHHLSSDLRLEALETITVKEKLFLLSATMPKNLLQWLNTKYTCKTIKASLQNAIDANVLPSPVITLYPLELDNKLLSESIIINPKAKRTVKDVYKNIWKYKRNKDRTTRVVIQCTKKQKLQYLNDRIYYAKRFYQNNHSEMAKFRWLKLCNERLKFLATCKNSFVKALISGLSHKRTLTFCASIEQSEVLGRFSITSKNKESELIIGNFNNGDINHITTCQMLNEGMNLVNCEYGIFANLNASDTIQVQRVGRLLRHPHPKLLIPFYRDTREEEILREMLKNYDKNLITVFNSNFKL